MPNSASSQRLYRFQHGQHSALPGPEPLAVMSLTIHCVDGPPFSGDESNTYGKDFLEVAMSHVQDPLMPFNGQDDSSFVLMYVGHKDGRTSLTKGLSRFITENLRGIFVGNPFDPYPSG